MNRGRVEMLVVPSTLLAHMQEFVNLMFPAGKAPIVEAVRFDEKEQKYVIIFKAGS